MTRCTNCEGAGCEDCEGRGATHRGEGPAPYCRSCGERYRHRHPCTPGPMPEPEARDGRQA